MSVKIIDNTVSIALDNTRGASLFLRYLLDDVDDNARPITPKRSGQLSRSTLKTVQGLHASIAWIKEYAGAQEAGFTRGHPMIHYTTPGTGAHYAQTAVNISVGKSDQILRKARVM
jgi:hypothetical protein